MQKPFLIPLRFESAEAARLTWKGTYFDVKGALVFDQKISTVEEAKAAFSRLQIVLRMVPFADQFRASMYAALGKGSAANTESPGVSFVLDGNSGTVTELTAVRKQKVAFSGGRIKPLNAGEEEDLVLSDEERTSLRQQLDRFAAQTLAIYVRTYFAPFLASPAETWKNQPLGEFRKSGVYPWQALFPASPITERVFEGTKYFIEDHYTTDSQNPLVTCIIFADDEESGKDVAWGGFRYDLQTKRLKIMNEFPGKYNAAEWLKQFDANTPFSLDLLFLERAGFMRTHFKNFLSSGGV